MRKTSEMRRIYTGAMVLLIAAIMVFGGCKKKNQEPETTAAPTTAAVTTAAPTTAAPETKEETKAEPTTAARQSANPVEAGALTEALEEINKHSAGGEAGSSLKTARRAAELMTWYMEEKPSGDRVMKETENYLKTLSSPDAFRSGLEQIYQAALDTVGEDGKNLLSDAGFDGEITWTEKDVNRLFNAIFEGSGQKK